MLSCRGVRPTSYQKESIAIVVSPLKALMKDQVHIARFALDKSLFSIFNHIVHFTGAGPQVLPGTFVVQDYDSNLFQTTAQYRYASLKR